MNHFETYNQIIDFRKSNPLPDSVYGENHHIVPKSICSILKDSPDNIVRLSAQEHFLAHYHLWLAYRDELHEKKWAKSMCFAFHRMKHQLIKCNDTEAMAKLYEEVRVEFSKLQHNKVVTNKTRKKLSENRKGKHLSEETKRKLSDIHKGKPTWNKGKHFSTESRKKMSDAHKGKKASAETKQKMSKQNKGENNGFFGKHHSNKTRKQISIANKGRHWYNNGITSILTKKQPTGFTKGRLGLKHNHL